MTEPWGWESPISLVVTNPIIEKLHGELENEVFRVLQRIGVVVDKDELIKALQYDRGQYEKGFLEGRRSAIKRGRWIKARGSWCTPGGDPVWECSECGKGMHVYGIEHGTYGSDVADGQWVACPNCGAKMDEVSE